MNFDPDVVADGEPEHDTPALVKTKRFNLVPGGVTAVALCLWLTSIPAPAQDRVSTIAGRALERDTAAGAFADTRFNDPAGLAIDAAGTAYVADHGSHVIHRLSPDGTSEIWAGGINVAGFANGDRLNARFTHPTGLALAPDGALLVADAGNHCLRRIAPDGTVTTLAGVPGTEGSDDGPAAEATFRSPGGLAVNGDGEWFIADTGNHTIRRLDPATGQISTFAGLAETWGAIDGIGTGARFNGPVSLAFAADGSLVVGDANNQTLRRVSVDAEVTTLAGRAGEAGCGDVADDRLLCQPAGVVVSPGGNILVADSLSHTIRRVRADATLEVIAGSRGVRGATDGLNRDGTFFNPYALAFDSRGMLWVTDSYNQLLREVLVPTQIKFQNGDAPALTWSSVIGETYRIEVATTLSPESWAEVGRVVAESLHSSFTPPTPIAGEDAFYRVWIDFSGE